MRLILLLLLCPLLAVADKTFDFNAECKLAYGSIIQLRLNEAQIRLNAEKNAHPDNLIPAFLENYIDFFHLFFNEDPAEYAARKSMIDQRLSLMAEGPESSPFYLFTKSVINFQWASVRLKFGYRWDGGWQLRRAFLDIRDNQKKFPSFTPNNFYDGAMKVAVASIPDGYKWLTNLFGLRATGIDGLAELEQFLAGRDAYAQLFHDEATFHYLLLKFYIGNQRADVIRYMRTHSLDVKNNHLFTYLAVNLSINNQQSANAEQIIITRNTSTEYMHTPVWDLELGYAKMNHLDDDAAMYLERFLREFKGSYYVKDVAHKLSWYFYLRGDNASAERYRKAVIEQGEAESDADKVAFKEAKSGVWPEKSLLRARLLNDGGYYLEALRILQGKRAVDYPKPDDRIEFLYRVARLYNDTGRDWESIPFYQQVVQSAEQRKDYYAARSALQLGYIYEKRTDKQMASYWFNRCIAMKDHDYKNSLDQRAKAGLIRCQ